MSEFLHAHATHPDWRMAFALVRAQLEAKQRSQWQEADSSGATLGWVYFTCHYTPHAAGVLEALNTTWPGVQWVGTAAIGIAASGVEYIDEPAMAVMLSRIPRGRFHVFSGAKPLQTDTAWTALVHADPRLPDVGELVSELSDRTASGYLFGGLTSTRGTPWQIADGLFEGGLSGVAFSQDVALLSRVSQGTTPVGPTRQVTRCEHQIVLTLDGKPAMECLAEDLQLDFSEPRAAIPKLRGTLVGLRHPRPGDGGQARGKTFGADVRVRHLIGLDPARQAVVVADEVSEGQHLAFCQRDVEAARRDLIRICTEIREELSDTDDTQRQIAGALYMSCAGRGGPHFGGLSAELQLIQHALGEVPLVGFFAAGEIGHQHLYGYTGVLTVFVSDT